MAAINSEAQRRLGLALKSVDFAANIVDEINSSVKEDEVDTFSGAITFSAAATFNSTVAIAGATTVTAAVTFTTGELLFNDNAKATFGTGNDVQVYWDAVNLVADSPTGVWVNPRPVALNPASSDTFYEIFDDFFTYNPTATTGDWILTEDDAADTQALSDTVAGGVLLLTAKAATDDDGQQIAYIGAPFRLAAGKHLWFECRIRGAAGATEIDIIAGLVNAGEDLTGVADNRPQDGIVFFKSDDGVNLSFGSSKDGTDTGTLADVGADWTTGWHTLGFYVNGVTSATPYYDGTAGTAITATFCDDESLKPFFLVRNGDGVTTQTLEIDYVRVIQLR